jgi:hypothetical protein
VPPCPGGLTSTLDGNAQPLVGQDPDVNGAAGLFYADTVKRAALLYGVCGGFLIVALRLAEYRFLVVEHSVDIYGALVRSARRSASFPEAQSR